MFGFPGGGPWVQEERKGARKRRALPRRVSKKENKGALLITHGGKGKKGLAKGGAIKNKTRGKKREKQKKEGTEKEKG